MTRIELFFKTCFTSLLIWLAGIWAILRLIAILLTSLVGFTGSIASRLTDRLTGPEGLRLAFTAARAFLPNLVIGTKIITSYENTGTALVMRFEDVKDVLRRDGDFEVVYGPRMERVTNGANFFLGMQDTPAYTRDVSNMRLAVRRDDVASIVAPFAARRAGEIVAAAPGRIDVPQELTLRIPAELLGLYFGTPGPSVPELIEWTTLLFWYLFNDLRADADLDRRAEAAAAACRAYLDATIAARKAAPTDTDDVLNRCLAMQQAGLPGMDDLGIRNNLIGLIIGAVPTISKAAVQALDQLLAKSDALEIAQHAARSGEDALLAAAVFEALRFNPINPAIYRRATRDTVIAPNTLRAIGVKKSTMVFAFNLSAMFDPLKIDSPETFRTDRPWDNYILWGDGLHTCFGAQINQALIPAILKPLLAREGLAPRTGRCRPDRYGRHALPRAFLAGIPAVTATLLTFAPMIDLRMQPSFAQHITMCRIPNRRTLSPGARCWPCSVRQPHRYRCSQAAAAPPASGPRAIHEAYDPKAASERRLMPQDSVLALQANADWARFNGILALSTARLAYYHLLPQRAIMVEPFCRGVPPFDAAFTRIAYPALAALLRLLLQISPTGAENALDQTRRLFEGNGQAHRRWPSVSRGRHDDPGRFRARQRCGPGASATGIYGALPAICCVPARITGDSDRDAAASYRAVRDEVFCEVRMFFFEKKNQKTFASWRMLPDRTATAT